MKATETKIINPELKPSAAPTTREKPARSSTITNMKAIVSQTIRATNAKKYILAAKHVGIQTVVLTVSAARVAPQLKKLVQTTRSKNRIYRLTAMAPAVLAHLPASQTPKSATKVGHVTRAIVKKATILAQHTVLARQTIRPITHIALLGAHRFQAQPAQEQTFVQTGNAIGVIS